MRPLAQGLFHYVQNKAKPEVRCGGEDTEVSPSCPCRSPAHPKPYSFSSLISTTSVTSSVGGMSVMAESSPSAADSFSIFFFCFR